MIEVSEARSNASRKYAINPNVILDETATSFYLLGALMSDGHINDAPRSLSVSITSSDKDWLEDIRSLICPDKPIYNKENCSTFEFSHAECMNWLISYGCTPRKSLTIRLEKPIPKIFIPDFIRGLVDGDGSVNCTKYKKVKPSGKTYWYNKVSTYICSASLGFIEDLHRLIPSEFNALICPCKTNDRTIRGRPVKSNVEFNYRLTFNDQNALKFLQWIYYPDHKLSMNRKREKAQNILETVSFPYSGKKWEKMLQVVKK